MKPRFLLTEAGTVALSLRENISQLFEDVLSMKNINYVLGIRPQCKLSLFGKNSAYCSACRGGMWGWGNTASQTTVFVS